MGRVVRKGRLGGLRFLEGRADLFGPLVSGTLTISECTGEGRHNRAVTHLVQPLKGSDEREGEMIFLALTGESRVCEPLFRLLARAGHVALRVRVGFQVGVTTGFLNPSLSGKGIADHLREALMHGDGGNGGDVGRCVSSIVFHGSISWRLAFDWLANASLLR